MPGAATGYSFRLVARFRRMMRQQLKNLLLKGAIVETKQPQTPPAEARENIMGTMEINPLLIKLSVP